jgi:hypothetical protein
MLCIFCLEDRPPTQEHVFPLAIGGTVTTDRVCGHCNSTLGTRVDAALSDFVPIRARRAKLGLAGNSGVPPSQYEMLLGQAEVVGQEANRVRITFDKVTGKLDVRQLHHETEFVTADGNKFRQVTLDERDKDQIPKIIQRIRHRHNLPPLSNEDLAAAAANFTVNAVDNPQILITPSVRFAYLRHAMTKIAYELAFLWLGEGYLTDPLTIELRAAIRDPDSASTDKLLCYVGVAETCDVFNKYWIPHEDHHLAYATIGTNKDVVICVRIFDIYAMVFPVSQDADRYVFQVADRAKLRFLAIDSVSGRTIDTSYDEEFIRLGREMKSYGRPPPFPDPL